MRARLVPLIVPVAMAFVPPRLSAVSARGASSSTLALAAACGEVQYDGEPSLRAKRLDIRQVMRGPTFCNLKGEPVDFDKVIGQPDERPSSTIVVFLRSLG